MDKETYGVLAKVRIERAEELVEEAQEYINSYKASLIGQLENTYIVRPDGTKEHLERKKKKWEN